MFTGIVDHTGVITSIEAIPKGIKFWVQSLFTDYQMGESIAVDGACLTVVAAKDNQFAVELSPETLELTTACHYQMNQSVNLERSLQMGDRLGGHWVTGHVDQTATVAQVTPHEEFTEIIFAGMTDRNQNYLLKKGSVCINGVSLTINEVTHDGFSVMIIPHTATITNLSKLTEKSLVNIEFDHMAKLIFQQVDHIMKNKTSGELA
jgi:riboflavin synthase